MATVQEARLAFLYTDAHPVLLQTERPPAPMRFMGNAYEYANEFDAVRQKILDFKPRWWQEHIGAGVELNETDYNAAVKAQNRAFEDFVRTQNGLTLPWPWREAKYQHHFWQRYLKLQAPNTLDGEKAWQFAVPLRSDIPYRVQADWLPGRLTFDAFYYPHGVALMIMARLICPPKQAEGESGWAPPELVEQASRVRQTGRYTILNANVSPLSLDELAAYLMDALRKNLWGESAPPAAPYNPFLVTTAIRGSEIDLQQPVVQDSEIQRALHSLCYMEGWFQGNLAALENARLAVRNRRAAQASSILYGTSHARVVWFPDNMISPSGKNQHLLGCYHRNLALLSLQTIMLCHAVRLFDERPNPNAAPPQSLLTLSRAAAGKIGLLYGAHDDTYKSSNPRRYIDDNHLKPLLDRVRRAHRMDALSHQPYP